MTAATKPAAPDWERIEIAFRAGVLSLREIAAAYPGTNHVSISRRAKKEGWTRNLAEKIQARADDLVTRQAVTPAVTAERAVTERVLIEANAQVIAQIRSQHRADIGRSRSLCLALLTELETQTGNLPGLVELGVFLRKEDERGIDKLNDIYQAVISLPERTKTMKALAETLKHLVGLEREAYNIVGAEEGGNAPTKARTLADFYAEQG